MKKLLYTLSLAALALATAPAAMAQGVGIGTGASAPASSAALEVKSTTQGMLVPRMTASQRGLIASPATGLMVYQTDGTDGFYFYNGTAWTSLSGGGTALPSQAGNAGRVLTTDGTATSWGSYNKETITMVRVNNTTGTTYTLPAFTNNVTTQIIIMYGFFTTPNLNHVVILPNPATVPDGSRVILKKYSDDDGTGDPNNNVGFSWSGWPTNALFNGQRNASGLSAVGTPAQNRSTVMLVKMSHVGDFLSNPTSTFHSWIPLLGWREN